MTDKFNEAYAYCIANYSNHRVCPGYGSGDQSSCAMVWLDDCVVGVISRPELHSHADELRLEGLQQAHVLPSSRTTCHFSSANYVSQANIMSTASAAPSMRRRRRISSARCAISNGWFHRLLVWEKGTTSSVTRRLPTSLLEPGSKAQWYVWKASAAAPLVVYDPEHRGEIRSAAQLFGNWAFGGADRRPLMRPARPLLSSARENGYEALATLDADGNGKVDGDRTGCWRCGYVNRDGISQPGGEVQTLEATV